MSLANKYILSDHNDKFPLLPHFWSYLWEIKYWKMSRTTILDYDHYELSIYYVCLTLAEKALRSSGAWSSGVLHEFEYFTKRRYYGEAAIASKDICNAQVINYDSLLIMIFSLFIFMAIVSLEYVLALLSLFLFFRLLHLRVVYDWRKYHVV